MPVGISFVSAGVIERRVGIYGVELGMEGVGILVEVEGSEVRGGGDGCDSWGCGEGVVGYILYIIVLTLYALSCHCLTV